MSKVRAVQAGDLIKINFDPLAGHEQAGWGPALVVSESSYNGRSDLALICPITSQVKGYPFEVKIPQGCAFQGVVLADQLKSADLKAHKAKRVGVAPREVLETIRTYIALLIGRK